MAITRKKKEELLADYVANLTRSQGVFLTDYRGLSVNNLQVLRTRMREAQGGYAVVKNTLAKLAFERAGLPVPEELMTGPVALGFAYGDAAAVAKVLADYARETKVLQLKGGILEGRILDAAQVAAVASLPPRPVVMAQLLGAIQQSGARVAGVVNATGNKLAATIKAYADKLGEASAAA